VVKKKIPSPRTARSLIVTPTEPSHSESRRQEQTLLTRAHRYRHKDITKSWNWNGCLYVYRKEKI